MAAEDELVNLVDELKKLTSETSSLGKLMANAAGELTSLAASTVDVIRSQTSVINELNSEKNLLSELKNSLRDEMSARGSEISAAQDAVQEKQKLINKYQSEIEGIQDQISSRDMTVQEERALHAMIDRYSEKLNETASLMVPLQRELDNLIEAQQDTIDQFRDVSSALDVAEIQIKQLNTDRVKVALGAVTQAATIVSRSLVDFAQIVRKTQQQFGIAAGQAANLKISQLVESISSTANTILTLGKDAAVSTAEIQAAQVAFQNEFGGVISSGAAAELAEQAKEMGVSVSQMAQARRAFLTTTLGNVDSAINQQERAIASFEAKGLTAKDAMAFIGQNAELVARSGTRFQDSLMRAAAVAKKIGVDLNKVNQVGDNIIGNFEGFLESMAELGAMGFGFDATRLAEIAETGDTGALFGELRSQLASTGKDITNLRRSEQLALSEAFGMDIAEFQRLAGIEVEGGGETMEDLQKSSNELLERLVNLFGGVGLAVGAMLPMVSKIALRSGAGVAGRGSRLQVLGNAARGRMGAVKPTAGGVMRGVGIGAVAGLAGGALEAGGEQLKESGKLKTGSAVSALGTTAKYAGMGAMLGSIVPGVGTALGAAVGGLVGAIVGVAQNFEGFKEMFTITFDAVKSVFALLVEGVQKIATFFIEYNPVSLMAKLGASIVGKVFGGGETGDDVVSRPGYGDRTLVTPSGPIALNNQDNVIAYADDMISRAADGITMLSKGALTNEAPQPVNNVSVDLSKLEAKLDNVVRAIGSMKVTMDGNRVGEILVQNEQRASTSGIYKAQRITD